MGTKEAGGAGNKDTSLQVASAPNYAASVILDEPRDRRLWSGDQEFGVDFSVAAAGVVMVLMATVGKPVGAI